MARYLALGSVIAMAIVIVAAPPAQAQNNTEALAAADILYRDGSYAQARAAYSRVLSAESENVKALNNRGLAHARLGDLNAAREDLDKALKLEKRNGDLWNNSANVSCSMKRYAEAFEHRQFAFYNGRFSLEQAQRTLRRLGYFYGLSDAVWDIDEDRALKDWTEAGCPNAPADRLL